MNDKPLEVASLAANLRSCNAVFRHFNLADSTKGKEQLDEKCGWIFRSLANDISDCSRDCRMEQDASRLEPGEVDTYGLSRLKRSHNSPLMKLCAESLANAN